MFISRFNVAYVERDTSWTVAAQDGIVVVASSARDKQAKGHRGLEHRAGALGSLKTWVRCLDPRTWQGAMSEPLIRVLRCSYPGVIVAEGLAANVDHFVQVVKSWQWKALQVRCELDGPVVEPPPDVSPKDAATWAVRTKSHLGPVLGEDMKEKVCVKEVEGLNEVGGMCVQSFSLSRQSRLLTLLSLLSMRAAGLEDVFYTALKLQK